MNPANQIAQLRDRLTALENSHSVSEASPTGFINPVQVVKDLANKAANKFTKNASAVITKGTKTEIDQLNPATNLPTGKKLQAEWDGEKWLTQNPATGAFDVPVSAAENNLLTGKFRSDMKVGGTLTSGYGKNLPTMTQKLISPWIRDPGMAQKVSQSIDLLHDKARYPGAILVTKYQYDELIKYLNAHSQEDWSDDESIKTLKYLTAGIAAVQMLAPIWAQVAGGIGLTAMIFSLLEELDKNVPMTPEQKEVIQQQVEEDFNNGKKSLNPKEYDKRFWDFAKSEFEKLKRSAPVQRPPRRQGGPAPMPQTQQGVPATRPQTPQGQDNDGGLSAAMAKGGGQ
jgi:hypothetical protein